MEWHLKTSVIIHRLKSHFTVFTLTLYKKKYKLMYTLKTYAFYRIVTGIGFYSVLLRVI
jgi:hypothetical protein